MMGQHYSVEIARPAGEVFAFVTNPEHVPAWAPYVTNVRQEPAGLLQAGSKIWQTVRGREFFWEIAAFEPDRRCVYRADYFYFTGEVTFHVEPTAGGARFSAHDKGRRTGLYWLLQPLLNRLDARSRKEQMATIKTILEQRSTVNDPPRPENNLGEALSKMDKNGLVETH